MSGIDTWFSISGFSSIAEPQGKESIAYVMRERTVCSLFSVPEMGLKYCYLAVFSILKVTAAWEIFSLALELGQPNKNINKQTQINS